MGSLPRPYLDRGPGPAWRRVLLVSYHFPPGASIGALRWQKFAGLLHEAGWGLDVIALDPALVRNPDTSRYADLPHGVRAWGVAPEPTAAERLERAFLRRRAQRQSNGATPGPSPAAPTGAPAPKVGRYELRDWRFSLPELRRAWHAWRQYDEERAWVGPAVRLGRRLAAREACRVVISSAPPHMAHEAARRIARATGKPFIMDMRDPWSCQEWLHPDYACRLWYALAEHYEGAAVRQATAVLANTPVAASNLADAWPDARILTVMNGVDDEPLPATEWSGKFVAAFAGTIYLDRDPRPLFRGVAEAVRRLGVTPAEFGLEFMGHVKRFAGRGLEQVADEAGIGRYLTLHGPRPRAEAMAFQAAAPMLISLQGESMLSVPAKIFDYLRFPSWMLVMAEAGSATAGVLEGTSADVVTPGDDAAIADVLVRRYTEFRAGVRPVPVGTDPRFTRRFQAGKVLEVLDEVGGSAARGLGG